MCLKNILLGPIVKIALVLFYRIMYQLGEIGKEKQWSISQKVRADIFLIYLKVNPLLYYRRIICNFIDLSKSDWKTKQNNILRLLATGIVHGEKGGYNYIIFHILTERSL